MARRCEGENGRTDVLAKRLLQQQREKLVTDDDALNDVKAIGAGAQDREVIVERFFFGRATQESLETGVDEFLVGQLGGAPSHPGSPARRTRPGPTCTLTWGHSPRTHRERP